MLIKELKIFSQQVNEQAAFYSNVLGLRTTSRSQNRVSLRIGASTLTIEYKSESTPYHFAINIPSNKETEALAWLKMRITILKDGDNEIQDFDNWNAKAMYFYDKDKNIVELISRKNLNNSSSRPFDSGQFIEISEIGLPTLDIEIEHNHLQRIAGLEVFDGGFERFCAIGDEHGLIICINRDAKKWFPTNDIAFSSDFEITFVENEKEYRIEYKAECLQETTDTEH